MFSDVISSLIPFEGALEIWKTLIKSTCYQQSLQIVSCEAPNFQKTTSNTAVICEWVNWRVEYGATVLLEPHIRFEGLHETTLLGAVCLPLLHGELNQSSHMLMFRAFMPDYKFCVCHLTVCLTQGTKKKHEELGSLFTQVLRIFDTKVKSLASLESLKISTFESLDFGSSEFLKLWHPRNRQLVFGDETHVRLCKPMRKRRKIRFGFGLS